MGVLSTYAPVACLPKRTEVFGMIRSRLIALETVGEDRFLRAAMEPLSKYGACVSIFVIAIGWSLTSKDAGDVDTRGGEYGGW